MLDVLGIDENLERPAAPVLNDVVQGDVDGVIALRPFQLVGLAGQDTGPVQRLGDIDDTADS